MHKSSGLPPLHFLQKSSTICLRYFITPSKPSCSSSLPLPPPSPTFLQTTSNIWLKCFNTPTKTLWLSSATPCKTLIYMCKNFQFVWKRLPILVLDPLQKPSDICLRYFMTPAKAFQISSALLAKVIQYITKILYDLCETLRPSSCKSTPPLLRPPYKSPPIYIQDILWAKHKLYIPPHTKAQQPFSVPLPLL